MKASAMRFVAMASAVPLGISLSTDPVSKVVDLLSGLQEKISAEGEEAKKVFEEYSAWCSDRSKNLGFEIKTGQSEVAELKASIEEDTATIATLTAKIDELASTSSTAEADLKAATEIRTKEATDFAAESKELSEVIDTLDRAVAILEREMHKGGASAMQLKSVTTVAQALSVMVQASMFSSADAVRLTALVQSSQQEEPEAEEAESEESLGAPAAAVYSSHSGGIIETLEGLSDKAQSQLSDARAKETSAMHNFELLKQSLMDSIKYADKDMAEAKTALSASGEAKATAEGDLEATKADLDEDIKAKASLKEECMAKAQDHEAATKSREEELTALAEAKKAIVEATGGAEAITYGFAQASFLQSGIRISSRVDLAHYEAVRLIRDLARKDGSAALAQLAASMSAAMRITNAQGEDPFAKVKGLIQGLLEKLEAEAAEDASHKAFCDKEMSETETKKNEKHAVLEKLTTKINQMSARSAKLKEEVAALQTALSELAKADVEMKQLREKEHTTFVSTKAEMEKGLEGVKIALKILREYYAKKDKAHDSADGASGGIVSMIEVVESDFSKGLAESIATEESAQASFEEQTEANKLEKAMKSKDVEYKKKESADLDKAVSELSNDRQDEQAQMDAILEYSAKLKDQCIAKPETYEERVNARTAEINGLKEALQILESETALIQRKSSRTLKMLSRHEA